MQVRGEKTGDWTVTVHRLEYDREKWVRVDVLRQAIEARVLSGQAHDPSDGLLAAVYWLTNRHILFNGIAGRIKCVAMDARTSTHVPVSQEHWRAMDVLDLVSDAWIQVSDDAPARYESLNSRFCFVARPDAERVLRELSAAALKLGSQWPEVDALLDRMGEGPPTPAAEGEVSTADCIAAVLDENAEAQFRADFLPAFISAGAEHDTDLNKVTFLDQTVEMESLRSRFQRAKRHRRGWPPPDPGKRAMEGNGRAIRGSREGKMTPKTAPK